MNFIVIELQDWTVRVFEGLEVDIKEARCTVSLQPTVLQKVAMTFFSLSRKNGSSMKLS